MMIPEPRLSAMRDAGRSLGDTLIVTAVLTLSAGVLLGPVREAVLGNDAAIPPPSPPETSRPAAPAPQIARPGGAGTGPGRPRLEGRPVRIARAVAVVPPRWLSGRLGRTLAIESRDGAVQFRIYVERWGGRARPAVAAKRLLASVAPGARVTPAHRTLLGGRPAVRVRSRYLGGRDVAVGLALFGRRYLVVKRVVSSARPSQRRTGARLVRSVRLR